MATFLASDVVSKPQRIERSYTAAKKLDRAPTPRGIAAHQSEQIRKLILIGATGLFAEGAPIGDTFMMAHLGRER